MRVKAEAYKNYGDAALVSMVLEVLPHLAGEVSIIIIIMIMIFMSMMNMIMMIVTMMTMTIMIMTMIDNDEIRWRAR